MGFTLICFIKSTSIISVSTLYNFKTNNNMEELIITKAIISDSKVLVALDYPIKDDVGKALDYDSTVIDKANRIIKNSFSEITI